MKTKQVNLPVSTTRLRPVCWSNCKHARYTTWDVAGVADWLHGCLWRWLLGTGPVSSHVLQFAIWQAEDLQMAASWSGFHVVPWCRIKAI